MLLFLDESGDHGLANIDPQFPVFVLSRDIRKCEKEFQILFNTDIKKSLYEDINNLVAQSEYTVIASAIQKEHHINHYGKLASDVYEIALSFILERSVFFLDDQPAGNKRLDIVIEKRGRKEDARLHEHFQRLCSRGTGYVSSERMHAYGINIDFKSKIDDVNGLQLADLIAYPVARYVLDPKRANPSFDVLEPKIYTKGGRKYGLKVFP